MTECEDTSGTHCSYLIVTAEGRGNITLFTWWLTIGNDPTTDPGAMVQFIVLLIVTIVAVIANLLILLVLVSNKKMRKVPANQYTALQCINYLWIICVAPVLLTARRCYSWIYSAAMCKSILYMFSLTTFTAIWIFVFISMDRHVHVVQSIKKSRIAMLYPKYPVVAVLLIVAFSVLFYLPLALYFDIYPALDDECTNSSKCFGGQVDDKIPVYICAALWPSIPGALVWNTIQLTVAYIVPLIILCYNYWDIYRNVKKAGRRIKKRRAGNRESRREMEIKVTVTCAVLVLLFATLWTPLFITLFSIQYARVQQRDENAISADLFFWIFSLSLSNAMFSPLVYMCMNRKFTQAWHAYKFPLLDKCACWQKVLRRASVSRVDPSSSRASPDSRNQPTNPKFQYSSSQERSSIRTIDSRQQEIAVIMNPRSPVVVTTTDRTESIEMENS